MVYEGYVSVGGSTVVNNALTYHYVQGLDCPFDRIRQGCWCETTLDLPGGLGIDPSIEEAPWYDPAIPDVSSRFFGLFGFVVKGLTDTNRSTQVVEGLDDGAWMGRTRRGARQMRVEGMLIAQGSDALDYGLAWLSAALDGDRCGQHDTACGVTDVEFFTDCPPERGVTIIDDPEEGPIEVPESDEDYATRVDPLRRYLHDVVCTSGPLEKRRSARGDWDMMDVEFTLTAGRPWIFEATRFPDLPTTGSTVVEDIVNNLVPYTSAELGGELLTVATNYSTNPSVEVNASGWGVTTTGDNPGAALTSGRVTGELQVVGDSSFRARILGGGSAGTTTVNIAQTVDISAAPPGPLSVTIWGAVVVAAGADVTTVDNFHADVEWVDGGGVVLDTAELGAGDPEAFTWSARSLIPAAGAVGARVVVSGDTVWAGTTDLRIFVDALAVTTP